MPPGAGAGCPNPPPPNPEEGAGAPNKPVEDGALLPKGVDAAGAPKPPVDPKGAGAAAPKGAGAGCPNIPPGAGAGLPNAGAVFCCPKPPVFPNGLVFCCPPNMVRGYYETIRKFESIICCGDQHQKKKKARVEGVRKNVRIQQRHVDAMIVCLFFWFPPRRISSSCHRLRNQNTKQWKWRIRDARFV